MDNTDATGDFEFTIDLRSLIMSSLYIIQYGFWLSESIPIFFTYSIVLSPCITVIHSSEIFGAKPAFRLSLFALAFEFLAWILSLGEWHNNRKLEFE